MNFFKKFFNPSKNTATQESPVVITQQKPIIKYSNHIITTNNIDWYRSNFAKIAGGCHEHGTDIVIIYRYYLDSNLHLSQNDKILQLIEFTQKNETNVLAHESKHWANEQFGEPVVIAKNYYEQTALYAFDELSAYAAGYLAQEGNIINHKYICAAVYEAAKTLLYHKDNYIPTHMSRIDQKHVDYQKLHENILLQDTKLMYSETFKKTVENYLTFDGLCLLSGKEPLPPLVKEILIETRKIYAEATRQKLKTMLNNCM